MGRIVGYIKFLKKVNITEFFYLNYFCKRVIRTDSSKIIPYKNAVLDIDRNARIYVGGGDIEVGCDQVKGSKAETRVRLREDAVWSAKNGCKVAYGSTIEVLKEAIFDTGYFSMNSNSTLVAACKICLGDDVMISRNVVIYDSDFHSILDEFGNCVNRARNVIVGNHVWIGANVTLLKGAIIGEGSIIGANATITGEILENSIVRTSFSKVVKENKGTWSRQAPEG